MSKKTNNDKTTGVWDAYFADGQMIDPIQSPADLKGGKLAVIMAYYLLDQDTDRQKFLKMAAKDQGKYQTLLTDYEAFYGCQPAPECIELEECFRAYNKYYNIISDDTWTLHKGIAYVTAWLARKKKLPELIHSYRFIFTILTGLEMLGMDPCGDTCWLNTLPNPFGTAEVYGYCHESGVLDGSVAYSLADFVVGRWLDEDSAKATPALQKINQSFNAEYQSAIAARPCYHDPAVLFQRSNWLFGHPCGKPVYKFAKAMADAPAFAVWEEEKALVGRVPVLANYWLLAHFFLGNTNACRECIALAKKAPGQMAPALAAFIEAALNNLDKPDFQFGELPGAEVVKIIAATQKNAGLELLEPQVQQAMKQARGEADIKTLSEAEFQEKIQAGMDPLAIIREYPEDIPTHDRALLEIGQKDAAFLKTVKSYFHERTGEAFSQWPYIEDHLDQKFSLPVAAAFRSGLKFEADNTNAFAGITQTLRFFDDDHAMNAYRHAVQVLEPSDPRLEYVLKALKHSSQPQAPEIIEQAAWRFFEILSLAKENEAALEEDRQQHGLTLEDLFETENHFLDVENHFLIAVAAVLARNDAVAAQLAAAILNEAADPNLGAEDIALFKTVLGGAFRVAGDQRLKKYLDFIAEYVAVVAEIEAEGDEAYLEDEILINFSEACIAYAKTAPDQAKSQLKALFDRKTAAKFFDLDIKAGVIGGLLLLKPADPELIGWLQRLLGNRNDSCRIYGALRAVQEGRYDEATREKIKEWVQYHLYAGEAVITETAWQTMAILGAKNIPPVDDSNKFGVLLALEELPEAFLRPDKYSPIYLCESIVVKKYQDPVLIDRLKEYFADQMAYSADDHSRASHCRELPALVLQGDKALPAFAALLKLEHIDPDDKTDVIRYMRLIEAETAIQAWLRQAPAAEIIRQLNQPEPRFIPWLDLLAAHAFFFQTGESKAAIEHALKSRLASPGSAIDKELTARRLPRIFASLDADACSVQPVIRPGETLTLTDKIGYDGDPGFAAVIKLQAQRVKLECKSKDSEYYQIFDGGNWRSSTTFDAGSEAAAVALANRIANEYLLMGYEMPKRKINV